MGGTESLVRVIKKLKQFESLESSNLLEDEQSNEFNIKDLKRASIIEELIWGQVAPYSSNHKDVVMTSAILIKIALSLYTLILQDDKDVEKIAQAAIKNIPKFRARMEQELNNPTTLH